MSRGLNLSLALLGAAGCQVDVSPPERKIRKEFAEKGSVDAEQIKEWLGDEEGKFSESLAKAINETEKSRGIIDPDEALTLFGETPAAYEKVVENLQENSPFMAQFRRYLENATTWCLREDCKAEKTKAKRELVLQDWKAAPALNETEKGKFALLAFAYLEEDHPYWDQSDVADSIVFGAIRSVDREQLTAHTAEKLAEKAKYHFKAGESRGLWVDSISDFRKAVELVPTSAQYHHKLGKVLRNLVHLKKAIELEPAKAEYQFSVGEYFYDLKKYEEALPYFQEAAKLEPEDAQTQYNAGVTLEGLERLEEALTYYQIAAELDAKFNSNVEKVQALLAPKPEPKPQPKPEAQPAAGKNPFWD